MDELPCGFQSTYVQNDDVRLHVIHNAAGSDERPALVFLHGFPEFWIAWRDVFKELASDYIIVAPDQRGFNLSDALEGIKPYQTRNMVSDLFAITNALIGSRPFCLFGHDWGASVAYAAAIANPGRIERLVVANGVHPVCFQEALVDDPAQRAASQYFHILAAPDAAARMAENDYARTFSMFEKFSSLPWVDDAIRAEYLDAWSQPGRLQAMLNWYAGSQIVVPKPNEAIEPPPLYGGDVSRFSVPMPHLLIWGAKDQALLPSSTKRLEVFAQKLTRHVLPDADHWLLHTHALEITGIIRDYLAKPAG